MYAKTLLSESHSILLIPHLILRQQVLLLMGCPSIHPSIPKLFLLHRILPSSLSGLAQCNQLILSFPPVFTVIQKPYYSRFNRHISNWYLALMLVIMEPVPRPGPVLASMWNSSIACLFQSSFALRSLWLTQHRLHQLKCFCYGAESTTLHEHLETTKSPYLFTQQTVLKFGSVGKIGFVTLNKTVNSARIQLQVKSHTTWRN
jgi:hypothetical protein